MDPFTLALLGGTSLASGGLSYLGSKQAAGAQSAAAQQSGLLGLIAQQQAADQARQAAERGAGAAGEYYDKGAASIQDYYNRGRQDLTDYYGRGTSALTDYYGRAREDLLGQAQRGEDISRELYGQGVGFQQPYRAAGEQALNQLAAGYAPGGQYSTMPTFAEIGIDPGYAFRFTEGLRGVNSALGSSGMRGSGAALKAATRYGQEAGSQEYQNAYDRFMANRNQTVNALGTIMGTGANAANTSSQLAGSVGNALSANRFNVGSNLANTATTTGGNIAQGAFNTGANLAQGATTAGSNLGTLASNAGATKAGAYTGSIPTMAALTSANPYGQAMENVGQARASGYVGGATALGNALNSGMSNALAYSMMDRFAPQGASGSYQFGGQNVPYFGRPSIYG